MDITKENIDDLNAVIKLQINDKDYEPRINEVLKDYRKKASIKGFRQGKVPMGIIKKMYGTAVLAEEVDKLVSESLSKYLTDEKLNILGQPLPSKNQKTIELETEKEFEFLFDIALAPEFELALNKKNKIPFYTIKVDDKLIEKQIENYKNQYGKSEQGDAVTEKSYIKADLEQLDENNNVIEDGVKSEDTYIALDLMKDDSIKTKFIGAIVNQVVEFDVKKAYPNDTEVAGMLKIEKEAVADLNPNFQVSIKEINNFYPAEVNQELFDKVFGKDEVKAEEEFKAKIKADIEKIYAQDSVSRFGIDSKEKLVQKLNLPLPDDFLKRWLIATDKEKKMTDEIMEKEYPLFVKDLQWQLIKEKIGTAQEIKVDEAEAIEQSKKDTIAQFQQYGLPLGQLTDEQLNSFAEKNLERDEDRRRVYEKVYEEKIVEHIKEAVKLDEKELTVDEFKKLYENN